MYLKLSVFFFVFCVYSSVPLGMDIFFHIYSYEPSVQFANGLNRYHLIFDYAFPRYIFLSYLYNFSSIVGFPIFFTIVFLVSIPYYFIIKNLLYYSKKITVFSYILLLITLLLLVFYSALSLSVLWLLAYLNSKKFLFRFGYFHPVSLIFAPLFIISTRKNLIYIISLIFIWFIFSLAFPVVSINTQGFNVDLSNIFSVFFVVLEKKFNEIFLVLFLIFCMIFFNNIKAIKFVKKQIPFLHIFMAFFITFFHRDNSLVGLIIDGEVDFVFRTYLGLLDANDFNFYWSIRD